MFIFCSSPKCTLYTTLTDDVVLIKDILEVTPKKDLKTQKHKRQKKIFFYKIFSANVLLWIIKLESQRHLLGFYGNFLKSLKVQRGLMATTNRSTIINTTMNANINLWQHSSWSQSVFQSDVSKVSSSCRA